MYRIQEKQKESRRIVNCTRSCFFQHADPSNWNILAIFRLVAGCKVKTDWTEELKIKGRHLVSPKHAEMHYKDTCAGYFMKVKSSKLVKITGALKQRKGARVAHWWEHSPATNLAPASNRGVETIFGLIFCWFSPFVPEVLLRVLRFSPFLKNQHFSPNSNSIWNAHVLTSS